MICLLDETLRELAKIDAAPEDVLYVIDKASMTKCSWQRFAELAKDYIYDNGFGGAEVNGDLIILGKDWYLERREYDGSEWWEYCHFVNPMYYKDGDVELDAEVIFEKKLKEYYGEE